MSDAARTSGEIFSDDDLKLLDHIDDHLEDADSADEFRRIAEKLRDEFRAHVVEYRQFRASVDERLSALENGDGVQADDEDLTLVERYAKIAEDEREDLLETSEEIAVTLHDNWRDIAWQLGGGGSMHEGTSADQKWGVDTKTKATAKYNPSKLRHELKAHLGRDPHHNEMYRGMKRLAELSGGEEVVNQADNRVHVTGGEYQYREMATADKMDTKRVLWRESE